MMLDDLTTHCGSISGRMILSRPSISALQRSYVVGFILCLLVVATRIAALIPINPTCCPNARRRAFSKQFPHHTLRSLQRISVNVQDKNLINEETALSAADMVPPGTQLSKLPKQLVKKKLQTFLRYLEVECWKRSDLRGLEPILQAVASACKQITRIVQRAQTDDVYGVAVDPTTGNPLADTNIQGEVQQKLDVLCNTIMLQAFCGSGREIHAVASEEEDKPRCCSEVMVCDCQMCAAAVLAVGLSNAASYVSSHSLERLGLCRGRFSRRL
jgi:Fructose-1-6-bisphosphatase, N-terminal domain